MVKLGTFTMKLPNNLEYLWQFEESDENKIHHVIRPLFKVLGIKYWELETDGKPVTITLQENMKIKIDDIIFSGKNAVFLITSYQDHEVNDSKSLYNENDIIIDDELEDVINELEKLSKFIELSKTKSRPEIQLIFEKTKYVQRHVFKSVENVR